MFRRTGVDDGSRRANDVLRRKAMADANVEAKIGRDVFGLVYQR